MNRFLKAIGALTALLLTTCAPKFPPPENGTTGILVIPTLIQNRTVYDFGYYYHFLISPDMGEKILLSPISGKRFLIEKGLPPGSYRITGVKFLSAPNSTIFAMNASGIDQLQSPIPFVIAPNRITLLDHRLTVTNAYVDAWDRERFIQTEGFRQLSGEELHQTVQEVQQLENFGLWEFGIGDEE